MTSGSDISGYHAEFHEGHSTLRRMVGAQHWMCELTRHGMAGERLGHDMVYVN
jgi:hypothetical protein